MPIESCQHGNGEDSDIVVSVKVEPDRPVQVEQTRIGLLTVGPCQHGKGKNRDIVVSVKVEPDCPVLVEQTRCGLLTVLQKKYSAEVTQGPRRGVLEVRVCHETNRIITEIAKSIEKLIRSQGAQLLN